MAGGFRRFPRIHRLTKPAEYRNVFDENTRSTDSRFVVLARKNTLAFSRLGIAISRKKIPRAVLRNRLKRVVRESFRLSENLQENYDLVVMPQKNLKLSDKKALRKSLEAHWKRLTSCENS